MKKLNRTIDCTCGIYTTKMTLICHKDGSLTIRRPWIKWVNNSGSLDFYTSKVHAGRQAEVVKRFFEKDMIADETGNCLYDYIGY